MTGRKSQTIKFCATGKSGLGHLRRVSNIAKALHAERPGLALILVTNASIAGLSPEDCASFSEIHQVPKERMAAVLSSLPRGPVVIDTAVIPGIEALSDPLALILRETVEAKLAEFRLKEGRLWDLVVVPSPEGHWKPDRARIGFRHLVHAGWIVRPSDGRGGVLAQPENGRPALLVATGGGGTRETAHELRAGIDRVLTHVKHALPGVRIIQAMGPRMPEEGRLHEAHTLADVGARLNEAFAEVDAVISTVGYNSVLELASLTTPALLVPISRTFDDQAARARTWGPKLGRAHDASDAEASAAWLVDILRHRRRRNAVDLGEGAAERAGRAILDLVEGLPFEKPITSVVRARAILEASAHIAHRGGPVLPLDLDEARELILMPRIEGQDLRKVAVTRQRCTGTGSLEALAGLMTLAMSELARFHRAALDAEGQGLKDFDPFSKIRPRMPFLDNAGQRTRVERLSTALASHLEERPGHHLTLVHGDFHFGQIMAESATAETFIIDLDDIARGYAEADIGNFAAHIVTAAGLYTGDVLGGIEPLIPELAKAYQMEAGALPLDRDAIALYAAAALLRRLLKLYVAGRDLARHGDILAAAETLFATATGLEPVTHQTPHADAPALRRSSGTYTQ